MRFLGIDYGTKRIGVATSDEAARLAFPREVLENDAEIFKRLGAIIEKEKVSEIVIGESVDFSGEANPISREIEIFVKELVKKFKIPVHPEKEFLTTVEARRYGRVATDASAAALILQRHLDKKNKASAQSPKPWYTIGND
jgi:putative holliday junction resolvase